MDKSKRDDTATLTAEAHGVSAAYVRMIINSKRTPKKAGSKLKYEEILSTYNKIKEVKEKVVESVAQS